MYTDNIARTPAAARCSAVAPCQRACPRGAFATRYLHSGALGALQGPLTTGMSCSLRGRCCSAAAAPRVADLSASAPVFAAESPFAGLIVLAKQRSREAR